MATPAQPQLSWWDEFQKRLMENPAGTRTSHISEALGGVGDVIGGFVTKGIPALLKGAGDLVFDAGRMAGPGGDVEAMRRVGDKIATVGNAVALDIPANTVKRHDEIVKTLGPAPSIPDAASDWISSGLRATFADATGLTSGMKALKELPSEPRKAGQDAFIAGLQFIPWAGTIGRLLGRGINAGKLLELNRTIKKDALNSLSVGELKEVFDDLADDGYKIAKDGDDFVVKAIDDSTPPTANIQAPVTERPPSPATDPELLNALNRDNMAAVLHPSDFKEMVTEIITNEVGKELVPKYLAAGHPMHEAVIKAGMDGALDVDRMARWSHIFNAKPEDLVKQWGSAVDDGAALAGKFNQVLSEAEGVLSQRLMYEASQGSSKALKELRAMNKRAEQIGIEPADLAGAWGGMWSGLKNADLKLKHFNDVLAESKKFVFGGHSATSWDGFMELVRTSEIARRAGMLPQVATLARDLVSTEISFFNRLASQFITGGMEKIMQKVAPTSKFKGIFEGQLEDAMAMVNKDEMAQMWRDIPKLVEAIPRLGQKYGVQGQYDLGPGMTLEVFKAGVPTNLRDIAEMYATGINAHRYGLENLMRRQFMALETSRMFRRIGVESEDALRILNAKPSTLSKVELDRLPKIKEALYSAFDDALKETFAYSPKTGLGSAVLKFFNKVPIMTALTTPYPRFFMNQLRYATERSPFGFVNLLDKGFRKQLFSDDPVIRATAQRAMSKPIEGLELLWAADLIRKNWGGPKYYQVDPVVLDFNKVNSDDPATPKKWRDIRTMQPFAQFMLYADMLDAAANNRPLNLDPNEKADALLGVRRISETFLLNAADIFRATDSKPFEKFGGQYLSSWLIPLELAKQIGWGMYDAGKRLDNTIYSPSSPGKNIAKTLKTVGEAVTPGKVEDVWKARDIQDNPLVDPAIAKFNSDIVPVKIDPFSGKPVETTDPWRRMTTGASEREYSALENYMLSKGKSQFDLIPSMGNAKADNLVRKNLGEVLSTRLMDKQGNVKTVDQFIVKWLMDEEAKLSKPGALPEGLRPWSVVQQNFAKVFGTEIKLAIEKAEKEAPEYFVERKIKNKDFGEGREDLLKMIQSRIPRR